jgi:hypothetical protein
MSKKDEIRVRRRVRMTFDVLADESEDETGKRLREVIGKESQSHDPVPWALHSMEVTTGDAATTEHRMGLECDRLNALLRRIAAAWQESEGQANGDEAFVSNLGADFLESLAAEFGRNAGRK